MLKILTVIGARPQFIKAAVVSRSIREHNETVSGQRSAVNGQDNPLTVNRLPSPVNRLPLTEVIVHTGQHFDNNMSQVFFDEMDIPNPDYNLNINSTTHGAMTGRMLEKIEEVILKEKPDWVLVYGDTNSTLAGALAASKLHIPVAHVEAGLRSFNRRMPEEQNRVLTDHISTKLFCPTDTAVKNLKREGIEAGVHKTGDVMYDAFLYYSRKMMDNSDSSTCHSLEGGNLAPSLADLPEEFVLVTLHRAENTDDKQRLSNIVNALNQSDIQAVLPLHPRTRKKLSEFNLEFKDHIKVIDPVGYLQMIYLENKCRLVVTDSGGVQKEAYFAKKPCITLRDETEWVETVEAGWNRCVDVNELSSSNALVDDPAFTPSTYPKLYGDGNAGAEILNLLLAVH